MMRSLCLSQYADEMNGVLSGVDVKIEGVSTDSRDVSGKLYFALKGERFDGHDYLLSAAENGAQAVVYSRVFEGVEALTIPAVKVDDTLKAYGAAARRYRANFELPLVGLTGSSGKTTTKNMLKSIFEQAGKTCATEANFNNEIGVPRTLFSLEPADDFAIVEMGARHLHDIDYLASITQPTIGMVLNAGSAHLGEFGSYENIVRTKGEIYKHIKVGGTAVINLDDQAHRTWLEDLSDELDVLGFAIENDAAAISAYCIDYRSEFSKFDLRIGSERRQMTLPLAGAHQVSNALAAASCAHAAGVSIDSIVQGLETFVPSTGRAAQLTLSSGTLVLDDSYNANPASMTAALEVLSLSDRKKIAVLGDMAELGQETERFHLSLGGKAKALGVDRLYLFGQFAAITAKGFGDEARVFSSKEDLVDHLKSELEGQEIVLIKGSRVCEMETIAQNLSESVH